MAPTLTEATPCADHRAMTEADPLPLARFTIVEVNDEKVPLCLRLATSLAAKIAADLGAQMIKIEPAGGDPVRRAPPLLPRGGSALFQFLNTSSARWCSISRPEGGPRRRLNRQGRCLPVRGAGIGRAAAAPFRATPIEIAAFPVEMDAAARPVSGLAIQALGGLMHMVGEPERKPLEAGRHQASYAAGLTAFTGLAPLARRTTPSQRAPHVRVSLAGSDAMW
jgi:crotonobetainyl-CoA:carnitine CoA-transferase CaiB-like acyl-CoA transferase